MAANRNRERVSSHRSSEGFEPDQDGLNWLARNLGYEGVDDLTQRNGYSSVQDLAAHYGFQSIGDFLSAPGLYIRLDRLRR